MGYKMQLSGLYCSCLSIACSYRPPSHRRPRRLLTHRSRRNALSHVVEDERTYQPVVVRSPRPRGFLLGVVRLAVDGAKADAAADATGDVDAPSIASVQPASAHAFAQRDALKRRGKDAFVPEEKVTRRGRRLQAGAPAGLPRYEYGEGGRPERKASSCGTAILGFGTIRDLAAEGMAQKLTQPQRRSPRGAGDGSASIQFSTRSGRAPASGQLSRDSFECRHSLLPLLHGSFPPHCGIARSG